jgi:rhamnose transport system ATP-binding protein
MTTVAPPVLSLQHATKSFGAVNALLDGTIELHAGQVHALVGENGAGKSTLVKILAGVHQPESGVLLLDGAPVTFSGPAAAQAAGVSIIYQEATLFPDLSVAENIVIGRHPLRSGRRIDRTRMYQQAARAFARLGVAIDPRRPARGLSVADQQIVEIAKAISFNARIFVMDEPTAALTAVEVSRLFEVVRTLREHGAAVLFISHRLEEVYEICQQVTIMRDGRFVRTDPIGDVTVDDIIRSMVGRDLSAMFPKTPTTPGEVVVEVNGLARHGVFDDVSLSVRAGEIVALAGLVGAGRTEVARAIFGIDRRDAGTVLVRGRPLAAGTPQAAISAGIGFVPEDRRQQGLVMDLAIDHNASLASLGRLRRFGVIRRAAERALAGDWAGRLRLKYNRLSDPAWTLSGGNQQKLVLAKWLSLRPTVLIIDEPTRGIDVGTKAEVHRLLDELVGHGVGILMISSELPEVLGMADRILVLREGRIVAELTRGQADEDSIMRAATGQAAAVAA